MFEIFKKRRSIGANWSVGELIGDAVVHLQQNRVGRDFVVGDIHGHFELFEQLLDEIAFSPETDRVISVGDGIDRGPESPRALEFLEKPWFHSIRGNHEAMLMAAQAREYGIYELWMRNGGEWSEEMDVDYLNQLAERYKQLPYAIEIETEQGIIGVLHADIPYNLSWPQLTQGLSATTLKEKDLQILLWARDSYRKLVKTREYPGSMKEHMIEGVYRVYVGHSIVSTPTLYGNMMFIDTGAYMTGKLTAVDLNNEEVIVIQNAAVNAQSL